MKRYDNKFRITCPDCGAAIITTNPAVVIWELCPSCRRHVWDVYDALMAEVHVDDRSSVTARNAQVEN